MTKPIPEWLYGNTIQVSTANDDHWQLLPCEMELDADFEATIKNYVENLDYEIHDPEYRLWLPLTITLEDTAGNILQTARHSIACGLPLPEWAEYATWHTPQSIVGGIDQNPGVFATGGNSYKVIQVAKHYPGKKTEDSGNLDFLNNGQTTNVEYYAELEGRELDQWLEWRLDKYCHDTAPALAVEAWINEVSGTKWENDAEALRCFKKAAKRYEKALSRDKWRKAAKHLHKIYAACRTVQNESTMAIYPYIESLDEVDLPDWMFAPREFPSV